ncbi:NUDIX domain-containing protein [Shimia biformata]|uniref:NUDIX domain-containing protein n=1 Tax=Shimia biformata TaxID=1294299 RepID=UPI00194FEC3F|nr:NUDIX domain-containing protein [Shimia biformata]
MTSLFFYGTLRHAPLLAIVLGRDPASLGADPATLADHAVLEVPGEPFPQIVERAGAVALGLLARNLTEEEIARLDFYEGGFGYETRDVTLVTPTGMTQAGVYFPAPGLWPQGGAWDLAAWQAQWGEMTCHAATEVMSYFGERSADEVAVMFPMIRMRAMQKVLAQNGPEALSPSGFGRGDVQLSGHHRPYASYFTMETITATHRSFSGGQSPQIKREVLVGSDAAILLPYDPVRDRVLLIEQFRAPAFLRGDPRPWLIEPIAGRIDPGETPEDAARREAQEEAGLTVSALHRVSSCYASPGNATEFYHIFIGITDLPDDVTGIGGLDSEAEDIRSWLFDFDTFNGLLDGDRLNNAPLVVAGLWLARMRDRLRSGA